MKLETYFKLSSYALIGTAFVALVATGEMYAIPSLLYAVAFGIAFYADVRGYKRVRLPEWMWRSLALLYIPFVFFDASVLSSKVMALVHMTLFSSAAKLFQDKRDRDWVFLFLISFFQMLLVAGLTFDTTFVASLGAFIFFLMSSLAAFEIRRARGEFTARGDETVMPLKPRETGGRKQQPARASRGRYLTGVSAAQLVIVVLLTLPFFFLIPRFGGSGVARGFGDSISITGFSDRVRLGQVASIKESHRPVMRIQLSKSPPRYLRWRGVALDRYENNIWSATLPGQLDNRFTAGSIQSEPGQPEFLHRYPLSDRPASPQSVVEQKILLEPLSTGTLFYSYRPVSLRAPVRRLFHRGPLDDVTSVTTDELRGRIAYTVWSDLSQPDNDLLRTSVTIPGTSLVNDVYLQVPGLRGGGELDPRVPQLARDVTRGYATDFDRAQAIETYLKNNFRYTLNPRAEGSDALSQFLFDYKEGHCEYFATAMVMMLRTLEIPARVVNGFQMGEYNDVNGYYTVRESDAHSWVDVYFAGARTWIEFDPTPPAGINDYSRGGWLAGLRKYLDAAEVFWLDYIVTLDRDEQASIMSEMQQRLLKLRDRTVALYVAGKSRLKDLANDTVLAWRWDAATLLRTGGLLIVVLLIGLLVYIRLSVRRWAGRMPSAENVWWRRLLALPIWRARWFSRGDDRVSAVLFYEQMLLIAGRAGLLKRPDQTPSEFAAASGLREVGEITTAYHRVRFGHRPLDSGESRRVSDLLVQLKQKVRARGRRGRKRKTAS